MYGRTWREEILGAAMVAIDTIGDAAAITAAACTNLARRCDRACTHLSDRYTVESDAHRNARERLNGAR